MRRARLFLVLAMLFTLVSSAVYFVPQAEASAVYSVNVTDLAGLSHLTRCDDDACTTTRTLFTVDVDVTDRPDPVTVDIFISVDAGVELSLGDVTATGSFYPSSYVPVTGWWCNVIAHGSFHDEIDCAMRIDQDTNAQITVSGQLRRPTECASANHTPGDGTAPLFARDFQADLYKHSDPLKSATDAIVHYLPCLDGNRLGTDDTSVDLQTAETLSPNGGVSPNFYYKPTGTPFQIASINTQQLLDDLPGGLTYDLAVQTPAWVTVTSCNFTNNGSTWNSPYNPPSCSVTNGGHTVTTNYKFNADFDVRLNLVGTIGSIPECPSANTFTKHLFDDVFFTRHLDGAWNAWDKVDFAFKCQ
jgi:hypothetical protein